MNKEAYFSASSKVLKILHTVGEICSDQPWEAFHGSLPLYTLHFLSNELARSRYAASWCSDGFRGLSARVLCLPLDTQQHPARHQELDGFKEDASDPVPERRLVLAAQARDQPGMFAIEWNQDESPAQCGKHLRENLQTRLLLLRDRQAPMLAQAQVRRP